MTDPTYADRPAIQLQVLTWYLDPAGVVGLGGHPRVIQYRLGHSTSRLSMELIAHVTDDADRDAAARLDHFVHDVGSRLGHSQGGA